MEQDFETRIDQITAEIRRRTQAEPSIGLILGSGLGDFAQQLEHAIQIPFSELPGMPVTTVSGHTGAFVIGSYAGKQVVALNGRVHYYEGYSQQEITIPVRVMHQLGVRTLILTNAAGGVNLTFEPGTLMLISDHINLSGSNPLIGPNLDSFGPRFPDMSEIYTSSLREKLIVAVEKEQIPLREGVYVMYSGPSYETPAEIRAFRTLGGDAVGMSTVPEAIVASHCGMQVLGMSCITNMAAGVLKVKLNHAEVVETANRVKARFTRVLQLVISMID